MEYWQEFLPPRQAGAAEPEVWTDQFEAAMPDSRRLALPLRDLGAFAVTGLIANQASFTVFDALTGWLAALVREAAPEVVVGLPTLGHVFGLGVARVLGHANWVAPGTSRKSLYDEALSVPLASITSPGSGRRLRARSPPVGAAQGAAGVARGRRGEHRRLDRRRLGAVGGGRGGAGGGRRRDGAGRPLACRAARRSDPVGGIRHAAADARAWGMAGTAGDLRARLLSVADLI